MQLAEAAQADAGDAANADSSANVHADAGTAGAAQQAGTAPSITLNGSAASALAGAASAVAHGGKPGDKTETSSSFVSSLTASSTAMATLHPGAAASQSAFQASAGGASSQPAVASNPYARLDEASQPAVLHASPQQMTVALHDASLGSLQVQVQSVNGQLAASLATATTAAHTQLSGHLASLTGYLQDQRVDVARVTVAPQSFSSMADHGQGSAYSGGNSGQPQQGQAYAQPASGLEPAVSSVRASTTGAVIASGASAVAGGSVSAGFSSIDIHA